jgi:hypothetical protein
MYYLCRTDDVSGTSGTGRVAQIAEFDDGAVVVRWSADTNAAGVASTTVFNTLKDALTVHGHEGRTDVELVLESRRVEQLESTVRCLRDRLRQAAGALERLGAPLPPGVPAEVPDAGC